eukprot:CAMPEP_0184524138 /NCGR_PEP_ID=MMETSP0198_2-20121128/9326_1 /TAXON_ID=1112570 /ORGANISM="Thraustochytrium sp., Strain LLF1b" /LENGTH=49 /DNA_ID= /DNA_START= /DNA_END= /DNA_ORIENTATION=
MSGVTDEYAGEAVVLKRLFPPVWVSIEHEAAQSAEMAHVWYAVPSPFIW